MSSGRSHKGSVATTKNSAPFVTPYALRMFVFGESSTVQAPFPTGSSEARCQPKCLDDSPISGSYRSTRFLPFAFAV
jgi:hypothetical protein